MDSSGRIYEPAEVESLKKAFTSDIDPVFKKTVKRTLDDLIEISDAEKAMLVEMNRHDRRAWYSKRKKAIRQAMKRAAR